jgi:adenylate cyclase
VSPAVYEEIMAGKLAPDAAGQAMNVCVLFSDIRGFTALSERLPPEMVTAVLTRYFDKMVSVVLRHDGTIDKFIGDGMMVFFGAPRRLENPCGNAVNCARDMVLALQELNAEFEKEQLPPIGIGIGINYGNAVVGFIGSSKRHNYSAIGDVVNVASRGESLTKHLGCQVLITDSVKLRLTNFTGEFELRDHGEQAMQGHSPVQVWSLTAKA